MEGPNPATTKLQAVRTIILASSGCDDQANAQGISEAEKDPLVWCAALFCTDPSTFAVVIGEAG
jgi:hypothetical protein